MLPTEEAARARALHETDDEDKYNIRRAGSKLGHGIPNIDPNAVFLEFQGFTMRVSENSWSTFVVVGVNGIGAKTLSSSSSTVNVFDHHGRRRQVGCSCGVHQNDPHDQIEVVEP